MTCLDNSPNVVASYFLEGHCNNVPLPFVDGAMANIAQSPHVMLFRGYGNSSASIFEIYKEEVLVDGKLITCCVVRLPEGTYMFIRPTTLWGIAAHVLAKQFGPCWKRAKLFASLSTI